MITYRDSGVDIDAGNRTVDLPASSVASSATDEVLAGGGGFGGIYAADRLGPGKVLVASTDGVGTKAELAGRHGRWRGVGIDVVNHCVNDILGVGAEPLFFLDYIATSRLVPEVAADIVAGIAEACREAGCALLGGETAEMPASTSRVRWTSPGRSSGWRTATTSGPAWTRSGRGTWWSACPAAGPTPTGTR